MGQFRWLLPNGEILRYAQNDNACTFVILSVAKNLAVPITV
jgi:hypothetical protein